jgi:hypothetical protein
MATIYQTILYKSSIADFELGWQVEDGNIIFQSYEYEDVTKAMLELNVHEPSENNWFTTIVERMDNEITDEEKRFLIHLL